MLVDVEHNAQLYCEVIDLTPPWRKRADAIVFSHGVGTNCDIWIDWLPLLAPHFKLVRFDTRGFGRSTRTGPGFPWSLELWAQDILAVARAAGAERFHLVGESLAGVVSLHLASRHPGALISVATCSSPYRGADLPRVADWRTRLTGQGVSAWSAQMMEQRFYPDAIAPVARDWFAREQTTSDAHTLLALGDMLLETDLTDALARIELPAFIMAADASPYVTAEIAAAMHRLIATSELQIFPNCRHGLPFSHGRQCVQALFEFYQRKRFLPDDH